MLGLGQLDGLGIIEMEEYKITEVPFTRAHANGAANLGLEIIAGEEFDQQFRLQKYDYENRRTVPIDLTGSHFEGSFYQAADEIIFTAINDSTGEKNQVIIALTEEQSYIYRSIEDDDARQKYVNEIAAASPIVYEFIRTLNQKKSLRSRLWSTLRKYIISLRKQNQ